MDDNARSYATMIEIGNTIVSSECITEYFACDLSACRGMCCIEGDAGAPVTADEIAKMEALLPTVSHRLSHAALSVIRRQGVAYKDPDGDMVTRIVHGRNCVFTCYGDDGVCLCALEREHAESGTDFVKPLSCALYPIRVTELSNGNLALNYHRWEICAPARLLGRKLHTRVYSYLRKPLIRAFGQSWYDELDTTVHELERQHILDEH